jgi:hypothetical protein
MLKQVFEYPALFRNTPCRSVVASMRKGVEMGVHYSPAVQGRVQYNTTP